MDRVLVQNTEGTIRQRRHLNVKGCYTRVLFMLQACGAER